MAEPDDADLRLLRRILAVPESHAVWVLDVPGDGWEAVLASAFVPTGASVGVLVRGQRSRASSRRFGSYGNGEGTDEPSAHHRTGAEPEDGVQHHELPWPPGLRILDATWDLFSRPYDLTELDVLYCRHPWQLGLEGPGLLVARRELCRPDPSSALDLASPRPMPPELRLALDELERFGGIEEMERRNASKAALLYTAFDYGGFARSLVPVADRSLTSARFELCRAELHAELLERCSPRLTLRALETGGLLLHFGNGTDLSDIEGFVDLLEELAPPTVPPP